jgi:hypothetical protein
MGDQIKVTPVGTGSEAMQPVATTEHDKGKLGPNNIIHTKGITGTTNTYTHVGPKPANGKRPAPANCCAATSQPHGEPRLLAWLHNYELISSHDRLPLMHFVHIYLARV